MKNGHFLENLVVEIVMAALKPKTSTFPIQSSPLCALVVLPPVEIVGTPTVRGMSLLKVFEVKLLRKYTVCKHRMKQYEKASFA